MARQNFPYCKFRFFPLESLWSGEGEGGSRGGVSPRLWCTAILIHLCPPPLGPLLSKGLILVLVHKPGDAMRFFWFGMKKPSVLEHWELQALTVRGGMPSPSPDPDPDPWLPLSCPKESCMAGSGDGE